MTTDEVKLLLEARERGFDKASKIIPAHFTAKKVSVILIIPEKTICEIDRYGNLVLKYNNSDQFYEENSNSKMKYTGVIYQKNSNKWATILDTREIAEELTPFNLVKGEIYFMDSGNSSIKWYITNNSEKGIRVKTGFSISVNDGYNSKNCYVENDCQFYRDISDEHAYTNMKYVRFRLLTEDEKKWFNHCLYWKKFVPYDNVINPPKVSDNFPTLRDFPTKGVCWQPNESLLKYLQKTRDSGHTINLNNSNVNGLAWSSTAIWAVSTSSGNPEYKIEQLNPFLIPEHLKNYPLTPNECYTLPEKWCLHIDTRSGPLLKTFLEKHKSEYIGYMEDWNPLDAHSYFFCYPQRSAKAYASAEKPKNYTEITTAFFLTHVLTHTDKQKQLTSKIKQNERQESSTIKVQRSDITIRNTEPIRGTGIKCSKIQIKIGSGHLPN